MLWLTLFACSFFNGPEKALLQAHQAWQQGDLEAFEAVVDLEGVAPTAAQGCIELSLLAEHADRQFQGGGKLNELGLNLFEGLATAAVVDSPEVAQIAREKFGTRAPAEACPAVVLGDPKATRVDRDGDSATVQLPIGVNETATFVEGTMTRREDGWHLVALDFNAAVLAVREGEEAAALERAAQLLKQLEADLDADGYRMLQAYSEKHPDSGYGEKLRQLAEGLLTEPPPVVVEEAWITQSRGLIPMKRVGARITNNDGRATTSVLVRARLLDPDGDPATGLLEGSTLTLSAQVALDPGETTNVTLRGAPLLRADAGQVEATVVQVGWSGGTTWVHPAREAGLWD